MPGLTKKQVKNFLLPQIGTDKNPDSAARLSCALLAVYARAGKRVTETYCPMSVLIEMGYVERAGTVYRLTALAKKHLGIDNQKKAPDPRVSLVVEEYLRLHFERFHFFKNELPDWDPASAGKAAQRMLAIAEQAPQVKGKAPEVVLRFVNQALRGMFYSEDDFNYFQRQGWSIWVLSNKFSDYIYRMKAFEAGYPQPQFQPPPRSDAEERAVEKKKVETNRAGKPCHGMQSLKTAMENVPSLATQMENIQKGTTPE